MIPTRAVRNVGRFEWLDARADTELSTGGSLHPAGALPVGRLLQCDTLKQTNPEIEERFHERHECRVIASEVVQTVRRGSLAFVA